MANLTPLGISGAWIFKSPVHKDERGYFTEWFKGELFEDVIGKKFQLSQSNISKSSKGVLRGIHFSVAKTGQAKWITCVNGSIWDVVIDIRPKSPTFKKWESIQLDAGSGDSIYISEGLAHAFLALEDNTTISYLLSSPYSPTEELAINPNDPEIAIKWPLEDLKISSKDAQAPSLAKTLDTLRKSPNFAQD